MAKIAKRSGGQLVRQNTSSGQIVRINAAGVPLPVPAQHQGAVKGAVAGGGIGATLLAFAPFGPGGILIGGVVGLTIGVLMGASEDEKRARRW
ncbi:hypothetical protein [Myxococcus sp. CA039A]|uniref:hypothetical protein n=1 Tax=Myxococcus sp. CA039A TaxID=2741737 RepID=UPI00157A4484|nr:hypothetical protein [Myxococcus sp. CA039A]NTX54614.1 hypothetical protein [Myxococcus sp. CA039A]